MNRIGIGVLAISLLAISSCSGAGWFAGMDAGQAVGTKVGEATTQIKSENLYVDASREQFSATQLGEAKDSAAEVTAHAVIVPNGPGTWMKDAPWNEVVFTVRNLTAHSIEIDSVRGVSPEGVFVDQGGIEQLGAIKEQHVRAIDQQAHGQNQSHLIGSFVPSLASTAVGMIPGVSSFGGGMPLAGARGSYGLGVARSQVTAQKNAQAQLDSDFEKITDEYHSRSVRRAKLAAHGTLTGSAFFSTSVTVTDLVVALRESPRGKTDKELTVKLPSAGAVLTTSANVK